MALECSFKPIKSRFGAKTLHPKKAQNLKQPKNLSQMKMEYWKLAMINFEILLQRLMLNKPAGSPEVSPKIIGSS